MSKIFLLVFAIYSLTSFAKVEEVELSTCFRATAPKRLVPSSLYPCFQDTYYGLSVSYSYTQVKEILVIVTTDYGQVSSEKVYKKQLPVTETYGLEEGRCGKVEDVANKAFEHFQNLYENLTANKCAD